MRFFSSGSWRSATGIGVGDANTWTALQTFDAGITVASGQNLVAPTIGPTTARQHTLPDVASDTITLIAATQTLTNKTFSGGTFSGTIAGSPTLSGQVSFTNATAPIISATIGPTTARQHTLPDVASDTIALIAASQTLTNKTFSGGTFSGTIAGTPSLSGTIAFTATSPFSVANSQTLTVSVASQTVGAATLTIPNFANVDDSFAFITLAQTLSNKTISGGTFSGTIAGTPTFSGALTLSANSITIGTAGTLFTVNQGANAIFDFQNEGSLNSQYLLLRSIASGAGSNTRIMWSSADSNRMGLLCDGNRLVVRDEVGAVNRSAFNTGGDFSPLTNKSLSIGLTGSRWLDVFTGNAVTSGTSRTVEVEGLFCPKCGVQAKRSTGGVVMNGYNEDYRIAFCPKCFIALIDVVKHQKDFPIPPFEEARFVNIETGSHGGSSNYIFLRFKYKFGNREYVNGTFLSEAERKIMEGADETAKKNLLEYLMQVEWEATYRTEVMGEEIKVLEAAYKANHMHALVGLEMVNRRA